MPYLTKKCQISGKIVKFSSKFLLKNDKKILQEVNTFLQKIVTFCENEKFFTKHGIFCQIWQILPHFEHLLEKIDKYAKFGKFYGRHFQNLSDLAINLFYSGTL